MFTAYVIHLHGNKFAVVCAELLMIMIMINNVSLLCLRSGGKRKTTKSLHSFATQSFPSLIQFCHPKLLAQWNWHI